jgi:hypothetical protein
MAHEQGHFRTGIAKKVATTLSAPRRWKGRDRSLREGGAGEEGGREEREEVGIL